MRNGCNLQESKSCSDWGWNEREPDWDCLKISNGGLYEHQLGNVIES